MRPLFSLLALSAVLLALPAGAGATLSFSPSQTLAPATNGSYPLWVSAARLTNSGDVDLVTTACGGACGSPGTGNGGVHFFEGNSDGTFTQNTANSVNATTRGPVGVATGDIDRDGRRDLV